MTTVELTTLHSAEEAKAFLLAVGTLGPTLHPRANVPDLGYRAPYRWNGRNKTLAIGLDATGQPVRLEAWHFASEASVIDWSGGLLTEDSRLGDPEFCWANVTWPVEAMPALSVVNHPEHTPSQVSETVEVAS